MDINITMTWLCLGSLASNLKGYERTIRLLTIFTHFQSAVVTTENSFFSSEVSGLY